MTRSLSSVHLPEFGKPERLNSHRTACKRYRSPGRRSLSQPLPLGNQHRSTIWAGTPRVSITIPTDAVDVSPSTIPHAQAANPKENKLLAQRSSRADGQSTSSTVAHLIASDCSLVSNLQSLITGAKVICLQAWMIACNSSNNGGSNGISDS